jgi:hypothetical protein
MLSDESLYLIIDILNLIANRPIMSLLLHLYPFTKRCLRIQMVHVLLLLLISLTYLRVILLIHHVLSDKNFLIKRLRKTSFCLLSDVHWLETVNTNEKTVKINHRRDHKLIDNKALFRWQELLPHIAEKNHLSLYNYFSIKVPKDSVLTIA